MFIPFIRIIIIIIIIIIVSIENIQLSVNYLYYKWILNKQDY